MKINDYQQISARTAKKHDGELVITVLELLVKQEKLQI